MSISEERLKAIMPQLRRAFSCWREYPDLFVDFLVDTAPEGAKKGALQLYFYQSKKHNGSLLFGHWCELNFLFLYIREFRLCVHSRI